VVYQYTWDFHHKELMAKSPFTFIADNFQHFKLETGSVICSGNRLPAIGWWWKLAHRY
jgi:hypothetical protein